eukprot:m.40143 g.40143  ORF g.40143 m.40143 type:complete len:905 (+) comp5920_c0_seq1:388-3102(+)
MSRGVNVEAVRADTPGLATASSNDYGPTRVHLNAMQSLQPQAAIDAAKRQLDLEAKMHSSHVFEAEAVSGVNIAHHEVAALTKNDATNVFFTQGSAAQAVQAIMRTMNMQAHHKVIHHGIAINAAKFLCVVEEAPVMPDGGLDVNTLKDIVDDSVQLVVVPHVDPATGELVDTARIVDLAHGCGARVLLDASSTVGCIPADADAGVVDFWVASGHGYLRAARGISACVVRDPKDAETFRADHGFCGLDDAYTEAAGNFGTFAFVAAFGAACGYLATVGLAAAREHIQALTAEFVATLNTAPGIDVSVVSSMCGTVLFRCRHTDGVDIDVVGLERFIAAEGVVVAKSTHWVEVHIHYYNTREEVRQAADRIVAIITRAIEGGDSADEWDLVPIDVMTSDTPDVDNTARDADAAPPMPTVQSPAPQGDDVCLAAVAVEHIAGAHAPASDVEEVSAHVAVHHHDGVDAEDAQGSTPSQDEQSGSESDACSSGFCEGEVALNVDMATSTGHHGVCSLPTSEDGSDAEDLSVAAHSGLAVTSLPCSDAETSRPSSPFEVTMDASSMTPMSAEGVNGDDADSTDDGETRLAFNDVDGRPWVWSVAPPGDDMDSVDEPSALTRLHDGLTHPVVLSDVSGDALSRAELVPLLGTESVRDEEIVSASPLSSEFWPAELRSLQTSGAEPFDVGFLNCDAVAESDAGMPPWSDMSDTESSDFSNVEIPSTTTYSFDNPLFGVTPARACTLRSTMSVSTFTSDTEGDTTDTEDDTDCSRLSSPVMVSRTAAVSRPIAIRRNTMASKYGSLGTPQSPSSTIGLHAVLDKHDSPAYSPVGSPRPWRGLDHIAMTPPEEPVVTLEDLRSSTPPPIRSIHRSRLTFSGLGSHVSKDVKTIADVKNYVDNTMLAPQMCKSL